MKTEHYEAIQRAKLLNVAPSDLAHELTVRDMVEAALFEIKNIHAPWSKLNEGSQQEVIDRLNKAAEESVLRAISIISSRSVEAIPLTVTDTKLKVKGITVTGVIDPQDPNRKALIDVAGKLCLLVLSPHDYAEALDSNQPDRDQKDLPLHVSDLTGSLFQGGTGPDEPDGEDVFVGDDQDPLYVEAVQYVTETRRASISAVQRHLKVGYNRAARMIQWMETQGIVTEMDTNGGREVLVQNPPASGGGVDRPSPELDKEFGDYDYDDAAQLIVLKAPEGHFEASWIQSRLAINSEQATTLLLRLLDNGVIKLEKEGPTALEHSYFVVATLADVT